MFNIVRLFTLLMLFGISAQAKFDLFLTQKLTLPTQVELPPSAITEVSNKVNQSLTSADSSRTVVTKIIDSSLSYWWDKSGIKNTSMGQAVEVVEHKMRADVNLGSTINDNNSQSTQHKLSFRLLAAQALAKVEYLGWFNGAVLYNARNATAEAEILENLANNKDLVVSHSVSPAESKSQLSLRWNW
jgi:hypothetical protein